ncbi:hypothetical protein [Brevundimonas aurantiaca]|uniref:hypothetical protein n=1 Tax=Brevundimonas aurantiaca TaxID=74316 RepID=UPI001CD25AAE|nr:hypothetical protein [Brevundimonas aurantiaca]
MIRYLGFGVQTLRLFLGAPRLFRQPTTATLRDRTFRQRRRRKRRQLGLWRTFAAGFVRDVAGFTVKSLGGGQGDVRRLLRQDGVFVRQGQRRPVTGFHQASSSIHAQAREHAPIRP